jgi:anti-anti-sigma factor
MSLKVTISEKESGYYNVILFGSIDSGTYTILELETNPILIPSTRGVVLEMSGVDYVSSMGIGTILKIKKTLEQHGGKLMITNLQPQVRKVFDIIKATPGTAIFQSVEEADAYLEEIQKKELDKQNPFRIQD